MCCNTNRLDTSVETLEVEALDERIRLEVRCAATQIGLTLQLKLQVKALE